MNVLPSSILLSTVATFDSIIGDFIAKLIELKPSSIEFGEKSIPYRELFTIEDLDQVRRKLIDSEVDRLLRGSHTDQVRYIEKISDTEIIKHHQRWPNFFEIFERRNQYAHANGLATKAYIDKLGKVNYPVSEIEAGRKLILNTSYLHKSVDYLIEFGTLLGFVVWRKSDEDSNAAFKALSDAAYFYITKKRYKLASWLLDFALHRQSRKSVEEARIRLMYINLANALKKQNKFDEAKADGVDAPRRHWCAKVEVLNTT